MTKPKSQIRTPAESARWQRAQKLGLILGEVDIRAAHQIDRLLDKRGTEWVKERARETWQIQKSGGMSTDDGKRRRTPGGVFFHVCKQRWWENVHTIEPELERL